MEIIQTKDFNFLKDLNLNQKAENMSIKEFIVEMSTERWNSIIECKERFLRYGDDPHNSPYMYSEIADSWVRSKKFGVDPYQKKLGYILKPGELKTLILDKWNLVNITKQFMVSHLNLLSLSGSLMCLTDENGVLLFSYGNKNLIEMLEAINAVPGAVWTEKSIGTNCHSMCINLQKPVQIMGPYYYCDIVNDNIGSSTPIMDDSGKLLGVLLVVTVAPPEKQVRQTSLLSWVISAGLAIESRLRLQKQSYILSLTGKTSKTPSEAPIQEGRIILDREKNIYHIDREAADIIGIQRNEAIDRHFSDVFKFYLPIEEVLQQWEPIYNFQVFLDKPSSGKMCDVDIEPIFNGECKEPNGVLLRIVLIGNKRQQHGPDNGGEKDSFASIYGESQVLQRVIQKARKVARYEGGILLRGESGTGKELFAQAIHDESRLDGPFVAINCAAIPKSLIESELFGYEGGSFTGAERRGRAGKIELAEGGILFLDEIGDMPLDLQPVLLRVLEDKKVMRIGSNKYIPVDFRVIAATNKDLWEMVLNKEFREDLYFRLAVFKLEIPPLRTRGSDILKLAEYFIERNCKRLSINKCPLISPEVSDVLLKYDWPGNVRQLENVIAYSLAMLTGDTITVKHLPEEMLYMVKFLREKKEDGCSNSWGELSNIEKMEKSAIQDAMRKNRNNVKNAAKMLGLGKSTLYRKMKKYEIEF